MVTEPRELHGRRTFAQAHQDLFVLAMLGEKKNGSYLELGAGDPFAENNTALLELDYGWFGLSLELDKELHAAFSLSRTNPCFNVDAQSFGYSEVLAGYFPDSVVDYLSIDVDDNLPLLHSLPFNQFRFAVITFEHDAYLHGPEVMRKSRNFFDQLGYRRICSNVCTQGRDFEDWYVDPTLVPEKTFGPFVSEGCEAGDIFAPASLA